MSTATGEIEVDVLIIGAGPVGLFGAYYAGFRELRVAVVDALPEVGGQISAMYPEKDLLDVAGFPAVKGRNLVARLVAQADRFSPLYLLGQQAKTVERTTATDGTEALVVTTATGLQVSAGAVIITGGIGTFTPRPLPAGSEYEGRGLAYFVPEVDEYAGCDVVIVGGGDSAFDWAQTLHPIARSVTLVHRRDTFRAHAHTVTSVRDAGVPILTSAQVSRVHGDDHVEAVEVSVDGEGSPRRLDCQRLVAALGFTANLGPLRSWGLDIANNRHIVVDSAMRTNQPGIFAAGDITDYDGKVRLVAVGVRRGRARREQRRRAHRSEAGALPRPLHRRRGSAAAAGRCHLIHLSHFTIVRRGGAMPYVIAEPCIDVTDRSCVDECPVDCIYEGSRKLYINPVECIDCGACEPVCPVEAISQDRAVPADQEQFVADNAHFFEEPLPGKDEPVGAPGGASAVGPLGVDTDLVSAYEDRS